MKPAAVCAALLSAVVLTVSLVAAQQDQGESGMSALPTPGEKHEILARKVGSWDATLNITGMPESKATYTARMDHGGLWLVGEYRGEFMGGPFSGQDLQGYSAEKGKFTGVWVDSWIDTPLLLEGDYDAATQTLNLWTESKDLATGRPFRERHDTHFVDADTWTYTMSHPTPDGGYEPVMTITYKRK